MYTKTKSAQNGSRTSCEIYPIVRLPVKFYMIRQVTLAGSEVFKGLPVYHICLTPLIMA